MIPLYGFLEGDTIGLLILAEPTDTLAELAAKLQQSASVRVRPRDAIDVEVNGTRRPLVSTVASVGLTPLDRFDVRAQGVD